MVDYYFEAAESDSAIDQQKAGLKSKVQSVSCYLKDILDTPTHMGSHRSYTRILLIQRQLSFIVNIFMNTVMSLCSR